PRPGGRPLDHPGAAEEPDVAVTERVVGRLGGDQAAVLEREQAELGVRVGPQQRVGAARGRVREERVEAVRARRQRGGERQQDDRQEPRPDSHSSEYPTPWTVWIDGLSGAEPSFRRRRATEATSVF